MNSFFHQQNYQVQKYTANDFSEVWEILVASFPPEELFSQSEMSKRLLQKQTETWLLTDSNQSIALLLVTHDLKDFSFIEYLAVSPCLRSQGLGGAFMRFFRKRSNKPILFESELPRTKTARKRLEFHRRCGFQVMDIAYKMPAIHPHDEPIPMHILTDFSKIQNRDNEQIHQLLRQGIKSIYTNVYEKEMLWQQNQNLLKPLLSVE